MTERDFLHDLWCRSCGLDVRDPLSLPCLESLRRSEWSPAFENLMRNRMIQGAFRYGLLGTPGKPDYDRLKSIEKRLAKYRKDKNREHLVDIANLCLCEYVEGNGHFKTIDDGEHTL